jgi:hypothetical protein
MDKLPIVIKAEETRKPDSPTKWAVDGEAALLFKSK